MNFNKIFAELSIGFSGIGYNPFSLKLLKIAKKNLKVVRNKFIENFKQKKNRMSCYYLV